jgi:hypothetical protein
MGALSAPVTPHLVRLQPSLRLSVPHVALRQLSRMLALSLPAILWHCRRDVDRRRAQLITQQRRNAKAEQEFDLERQLEQLQAKAEQQARQRGPNAELDALHELNSARLDRRTKKVRLCLSPPSLSSLSSDREAGADSGPHMR